VAAVPVGDLPKILLVIAMPPMRKKPRAARERASSETVARLTEPAVCAVRLEREEVRGHGTPSVWCSWRALALLDGPPGMGRRLLLSHECRRDERVRIE
jgi:hypothetical protein